MRARDFMSYLVSIEAPPARRKPPVASCLALVSGLAAVLAPKCPFCVAAYLSAFGVGVGAASTVVPWLRLIGVALAVLALASIILRARRSQTATLPTKASTISTGRT